MPYTILKRFSAYLAEWLIIMALFGCGSPKPTSSTAASTTSLSSLVADNQPDAGLLQPRNVTAHGGPMASLAKQPTVWILGDDLVSNWQANGPINKWTFYPPPLNLHQETAEDVANRLNHLLLGTPTGDPSDLPPASPVLPPDLIVILAGTFDLVEVLGQEPDYGPCAGTNDPTIPQIPSSACESYYGMVTQSHTAGTKILFLTLPLTTSQYQAYSPDLSIAEQRFNAYLKGPGLTQFGEDGIIDLSSQLQGKWTDDGLTFNAVGAALATKTVQDWITQSTAIR